MRVLKITDGVNEKLVLIFLITYSITPYPGILPIPLLLYDVGYFAHTCSLSNFRARKIR